MSVPNRPVVSLYVDRLSRQWVVRDASGDFWILFGILDQQRVLDLDKTSCARTATAGMGDTQETTLGASVVKREESAGV
jgi:hypothetical protein